MTHGLTLGKYAPLHRGHRLVIETALAETDCVTVIVYDCPETTPVPVAVRADWIRKLYPTVRVLEAWDGPTEVGYTLEIMRQHETYVRDTLGLRDVTHFYSSEPYGDHMSVALGAVNRMVDVARERVPVSGTAIRTNPYRYRAFLDPLVYRDLIANVVLLGAPSTGKTTLAERLAQEFGTVWMPEYGREYWETHQIERRLTPEQLLEIAEGHIEREEKRLGEADRYLFTDTNALTTLTFARYYHGTPHPRLAELADRSAHRYDLVLVCDTDIPYDDTPDRSGDANRQTFQRQVIADLNQRKIPFVLISGDLETRVAQVRAILSRFEKWGNSWAFYGKGEA